MTSVGLQAGYKRLKKVSKGWRRLINVKGLVLKIIMLADQAVIVKVSKLTENT